MATENKYKKGDWVRVVDCGGDPDCFTDGQVCQVTEVHGSLVYCGDGAMYPHRFEPWQPKVGERVRYVANYNEDMGCEEATVVDVVDPTHIMVDTHSHWGRCTEHIKDLEPVTDTPPVAEQPAALTIQAGKFYKTRDGRKVGPMAARSWGGFFDDSRSVTSQHWSASGTYIEGCISNLDLIAEWVDTPAKPTTNLAATVDAINDEYGPVVREVYGDRDNDATQLTVTIDAEQVHDELDTIIAKLKKIRKLQRELGLAAA